MSKIEVNTVDTQCGTNLTVGAACKSVTVAGNDLRSNAYKAADGGNIASQSGTTITLGASGDTVTLASGASQSGFGRTGTVDWQTGSIKTSNFTASNGEGYFVNTTGGAITVTLPAGSAGSIVSLKDYANTWDTNNVTVTPNGSDKINGVNASSVLTTEDQSITLVYVDGTKGWRVVQDSTSNVTGTAFIAATGGTIVTCGDFKIHVFTGPGTFCVSQNGTGSAPNDLDYMVVAGGGGGGAALCGGGNSGAGGAGAGGFRESKSGNTGSYTASPLATSTSIPASITGYPITVGGGGTGAYGKPSGSETNSTNGSNSVFSTITSAGGGRGGQASFGTTSGGNGGSGGGGATAGISGGTGNTPPVSPPQGNNGGTGGPSPGQASNGGGGGGAGAAGANGAAIPSGTPGPGWPRGGDGTPTASVPSSYGTTGPAPGRYFAGGGSGGAERDVGPGGNGQIPGGAGGGGYGSNRLGAGGGTANTGGGGGGGGGDTPSEGGGGGGSGIVMIRYKFQ